MDELRKCLTICDELITLTDNDFDFYECRQSCAEILDDIRIDINTCLRESCNITVSNTSFGYQIYTDQEAELNIYVISLAEVICDILGVSDDKKKEVILTWHDAMIQSWDVLEPKAQTMLHLLFRADIMISTVICMCIAIAGVIALSLGCYAGLNKLKRMCE
jgi:hypothetical protein